MRSLEIDDDDDDDDGNPSAYLIYLSVTVTTQKPDPFRAYGGPTALFPQGRIHLRQSFLISSKEMPRFEIWSHAVDVSDLLRAGLNPGCFANGRTFAASEDIEEAVTEMWTFLLG